MSHGNVERNGRDQFNEADAANSRNRAQTPREHVAPRQTSLVLAPSIHSCAADHYQ